jgi:hypothetical protein
LGKDPLKLHKIVIGTSVGKRSFGTLYAFDWYFVKISKELYKRALVHDEYSDHPPKFWLSRICNI